MKKYLKIIAIGIAGISTYILMGASCIPNKSIPVNGFLFGNSIQITVDNVLAKNMLTNPEHWEVRNLYSSFQNKPLNTTTLSAIADKYSMDVATLYFLKRTYNEEKNFIAQNLYLDFLKNLNEKNYIEYFERLNDYYVVFVPGLDYNDTTNGGNFARQRRLLTSHGVNNELILTDDWGLSDDNAVIIAKRLRLLSLKHEKILIVSASKGGLETAIALGKILQPEETNSIKAWVSVGGVLKGSPVADTYLCWPKCWIAEIGLMTVGQKISLVKDVSYKKRSQEFDQLSFPENIQIIHFVGAPLATQIHKRIKSNYCSIKQFGPNDGITPLMDEVTENGIIVSEIGLDHYYSSPTIDKKTISLALVVAQLQSGK